MRKGQELPLYPGIGPWITESESVLRGTLAARLQDFGLAASLHCRRSDGQIESGA
jgi:hypothetical protein